MKYRNVIILISALFISSCQQSETGSIDRFDLVNRQNVVITEIDSLNTLTVGNGNYAFSADITGMQTFPEYYVKGIPLGTFSNWCWHSFPNKKGFQPSQTLKYFEVGDQSIPYYHDFGKEKDSERALASSYFRENPHRMNMGIIALKILKEDGERITKEDILTPEQVLNLWEGEIKSCFKVEGTRVQVKTICHPYDDILAFHVESELIAEGRLSIELRFPEADDGWKNIGLWGDNKKHQSEIKHADNNTARLFHRQDTTEYQVDIQYNKGRLQETDDHTFELQPAKGENTFSCTFAFARSSSEQTNAAAFKDIKYLSTEYWKKFWNSGGAVDFSNCTDPRADELERRVILSQYLAQVQCSGSLPPQETGLTYNSWFGKFHLEMHWWHSVHFVLWQRPEALEKQMRFYEDIRHQAKELAAMQGYKGLRWPKMIGPDGLTSPSTVGNYLIWQQPHYIYFAELLYHTSSRRDSMLEEYSELVFETADFMASYPDYEIESDRFVLGPALIPAQETFSAETTINPAFELTYWYWALGRAIEWKKRLNQEVPVKWMDVHEKLSDLPEKDDLYLFTEDGTDSYTNERYISDHPMILGCLGVLPETKKVNRETMLHTFHEVVKRWNWERTWGWDYPMVAMSAAELGLAEEAIDYLLYDVQKNTYLPNGHNYQDGRLTIYMPGNGALLTAVARMCTKDQFPKNGKWDVRWEMLNDF